MGVAATLPEFSEWTLHLNVFSVKVVQVCPPNFETLFGNFENENETLN